MPKQNGGAIVPLEYDEQCAVVDYLEIKGHKFSKIAQDTYTKSWAVKMRNKRSGLRPGLPDLLVIKDKELIFCEMKRLKGGVVSDEQRDFIDALNNCKTIRAFVAKGADDAIKQIEQPC